jgi:hypothetical protein
MPGNWQSTSGEIFRFENENDSLEGTLMQIRDGNYFRPDGSKSRVYDIKDNAGKVRTVFGSMILERQMGSVKIGQELKIVFKGLVSTKSGRKAKAFDVFIR